MPTTQGRALGVYPDFYAGFYANFYAGMMSCPLLKSTTQGRALVFTLISMLISTQAW
jgi:hypothetical protein